MAATACTGVDPFTRLGPGVISKYTTYGNGTTQCSLAKVGTPCRATPDVSANADENTPYAEFCTGNANTPFSVCGTFSQFQTQPDGSVLAARVYHRPSGQRSSPTVTASGIPANGNANPLLYLLYNLDYHGYFHDITGVGQSVNNNGFYPTTPGFLSGNWYRYAKDGRYHYRTSRPLRTELPGATHGPRAMRGPSPLRLAGWNYGAIRFAVAVPVNTITVGDVAGATG